ncbi:O-antigen ligase family protein [Corallibacter sp.]|uniref:O-antigen ligase family protein n=1 Tax=Corallibacter sp. TaxID=2038084 RepID=UPI003AB20510
MLTEKSGFKKYAPIFSTIILCFLSGSRAGFFIILVQIIVFIFYTIKDKKYNKLFVKIFLSLTALITVSILFFAKPIYQYTYSKVVSFKTDDDVHALSNKSRFGIQYAMFQVFLKNPIKGTGYGLQAFESKDLYPEWAVENNWEFRLKYLNEEVKSFPPGYNLYLRLLSETGIIGFVLFIFFLLIIFLWCYNKTFKKQGQQTIMPLVITISMVGFAINWMKVDTFRMYFFWLSIVLIILLQKQSISNDKEEKNNNLNSSL